jgi:hypothetical protein
MRGIRCCCPQASERGPIAIHHVHLRRRVRGAGERHAQCVLILRRKSLAAQDRKRYAKCGC